MINITKVRSVGVFIKWKYTVWCGGEFGDLSETGTSFILQLESTCVLFFIWDKFLGSWIFNRHFKYSTVHFHEKQSCMHTHPVNSAHMMCHLRHDVATCPRFGGKIFPSVSVSYCLLTSHSAAIGKELNKRCLLKTSHTVKHLYFAWSYFREAIALDIFTRFYFRNLSKLLL